MSNDFDAYHKWLGIRPEEQPPNHYRLLGIELFESDPAVIRAAGDQRMAHVRTFAAGRHLGRSQAILNSISAAKLCLQDAAAKSAYDEQLRTSGMAKSLLAIPVPPPPPAPTPPPPPGRPAVLSPSPETSSQTGPVIQTTRTKLTNGRVKNAKGNNRRRQNKAGLFVLAGVSLVLLILVAGGIAMFSGRNVPSSQSDLNLVHDSTEESDAMDYHSDFPEPKTVDDFEFAPPTRDGDKNRSEDRPSREREETRPVDRPVSRAPIGRPADGPGQNRAQPKSPFDGQQLRIPGDSRLAEARQTIEREFEVRNVDSRKDRARLAHRFYQQALETDNDALRYALLNQALDVATQVNDVKTAVLSALVLSTRFEVDTIALHTRVLRSLVDAPAETDSDRTNQRFLAMLGTRTIQTATAADQYDQALEIAEISSRAARRAQVPQMIAELENAVRLIRQFKRSYDEIRGAVETLKTNPDDPDANTTVGRFYCFAKSDWPTGLAYLSRGGHRRQRALSSTELKSSQTPAEQLVLANGWYDTARDSSGLLRNSQSLQTVNLQRRALLWYDRLLPKLKGSQRTFVEVRIRELR